MFMKERLITQVEIDKCIGLLDEDYHGCPMFIFHNFWDYVKWSIKYKYIDVKQMKKAYKGKVGGTYTSGLNFIHIYAFNYNSVDKRFVKQCIIHTVLHELRHYYQYKTEPEKWRKLQKVSHTIDNDEYREKPEEADANKFAANMLKKYRLEISKILNVYPDWDFTRS